MATFENSKAGGNWNSTLAWIENGIPATKTPGESDIVKLVAESALVGGSITITESVNVKELEATSGFSKTFKINNGLILTVNGDFAFNGGTFTPGTSELSLRPNSGTGKFTPGSVTYNIIKVGAIPATVNLEILGTVKAKNFIVEVVGTLTTNSNTFELTGEFRTSLSGGNLSTFALGSSKIIISGTGGWINIATGLTLTGTSTIELTNTGEVTKSFGGSGITTYNKVVIESDNVQIEGSNTFAELVLNTKGLSVKGTFVEKSTTQTITGSLKANATAGSKIKLFSKTSTKEWKLKKTGGVVAIVGLELRDSHAEGTAEWYAEESTNVSGNSGWKFEAAKAIVEKLTGALTSAGVRQMNAVKSITPALNFEKSLFRNIFGRILKASLEFAKALPRNIFSRKLTASFEFAKALPSNITRSLTASFEFAKTYSRNTTKQLPASISFEKSLFHNIFNRTLKASLEFAKIFPLSTTKQLAASFSFKGALPQQVIRPIEAALSSASSTASLTVSKLLIASMNFAGSAGQKAIKTYAATLEFVSVQNLSLSNRKITAVLDFITTTPGSITHLLTATLSWLGSLNRQASRTFLASIDFAASSSKNIARAVTGQLSSTGSITPRAIKHLVASLNASGSLLKHVLERRLTALMEVFGNMAFPGRFLVRIVASLNSAVAFRKEFSLIKTLRGTLEPIVQLPLAVVYRLTSTLSSSSTISRLTSILRFEASLPMEVFFQHIRETIIKTLQASLSSSAILPRQIRRALSAVLDVVARLIIRKHLPPSSILLHRFRSIDKLYSMPTDQLIVESTRAQFASEHNRFFLQEFENSITLVQRVSK